MIKLENVSKKYDNDFIAVNNVSLQVAKGEIFGIIGYSGAGKSSLIRMMNQLVVQDEGNIIIDNADLKKINKNQLRLERQKIGMIFQHFNLLWSRTVLENVIFALEVSKTPRKERKKIAMQYIKLVKLEDKCNEYPSSLSGGQKQRVAIARALVNQPNVLLCDEATSALDPDTTESILELLQKINKDFGITIVLITHEMRVVKKICHRIAVMDQGSIVELKDTVSLFRKPESAISKKFINSVNDYQDFNQIILSIKEKYPSGTLFRLSFLDHAISAPLIALVAQRYNVNLSILYGSISVLNDVDYGDLIVHSTLSYKELDLVIQEFNSNDVKWEVV